MCTVTYIPANKTSSFVLTSNRDELKLRETIEPATYRIGNKNIVFPKDQQSGGSWIAANDKGRVLCLLNGAFELHQKREYHTLSRGLVLIDFAQSDLSSDHYFKKKDLTSVEPFTIVCIETEAGQVEELHEIAWDGKRVHHKNLNPESPFIWASATLYKKEHRSMREKWFEQFCSDNKHVLTAEKIKEFHTGSHTDDSSIDIVMNREGGLRTVSVSQITEKDGRINMQYDDLLNGSKKIVEL